MKKKRKEEDKVLLIDKIALLLNEHECECKEDKILQGYLDDVLDVLPMIGYKPLCKWRDAKKYKPKENTSVLIDIGDDLQEVSHYVKGCYGTLAGIDMTDRVVRWRTLPRTYNQIKE